MSDVWGREGDDAKPNRKTSQAMVHMTVIVMVVATLLLLVGVGVVEVAGNC